MPMQRPRDPGLAARLFGGRPDAVLALLRAAWPAAVGPELARRTEVLALDRGVLRVRVPDAIWRRGLVRMRGDILVRLRGIAGGIAPRALGFVEGPVPVLPEREESPQPRSPTLPPEVRAAAQTIGDPEIRARFLAAAGRYLGRFSHPSLQAKAVGPDDSGSG
jgi:Dna[CI] antecedent, DciA